jgi:hypothetical protein
MSWAVVMEPKYTQAYSGAAAGRLRAKKKAKNYFGDNQPLTFVC